MDRRGFLSGLSCALVAANSAPVFASPRNRNLSRAGDSGPVCWLDLCAPLVIEDSARNISSRIVLTSDTFVGPQGYADALDSTDYEIRLYDLAGNPVGRDGVAARLNVRAMNATVLAASDLVSGKGPFAGGMSVRLRPRARTPMHASDLFSSAFLRWEGKASFDNVHANPDPLQWQNTRSFFYSMPFPSLDEYDCVFSLFNPYATRSAGRIVVFEPNGVPAVTEPYELRPHASLIFDLKTRKQVSDWNAEAKGSGRGGPHGLIAVTNDEGSSKSFAYLMIRNRARDRFSIEHPIHQGVFEQKAETSPFDAANQFKAKNVLYSPLLFKAKRISGQFPAITLDSRFYLGSGLPLEESQWIYPFAVDPNGAAAWSSLGDSKLKDSVAEHQERGVIRLRRGQSAVLDFNRLSLAPDFSGGLAAAVSPDTTHTLQKVEIRVREWGAFAFTHFRPGLKSARAYMKPSARGALATDYIVTGSRIAKTRAAVLFDELIGVINIDDQGIEAHPTLQLFGSDGFIRNIPLGPLPPFACRHYLLSSLIREDADYGLMTMRLVDRDATLLMSTIHIDHQRRDIALDHGSDRFSTFNDYGCITEPAK